jgi:hypothetical protein
MAPSQPPKELLLDALQHPDSRVRQAGFALDDPYVEQVWVGRLGPSAALLLRRLPSLWEQAMPAHVDAAEFAASLGIAGGVGSRHGRIWGAFRRLASHGLATPLHEGRIGVFAQVAPVTDLDLSRLPVWSQQAHARLLGDHLSRLADGPVPPAVQRDRIAARLDLLQQQQPSAPAPGASL